MVVEELESPDQQKPALTTSSSSITGKAKPSTFSGAVGVSKNARGLRDLGRLVSPLLGYRISICPIDSDPE